jgi:hypothetical protein
VIDPSPLRSSTRRPRNKKRSRPCERPPALAPVRKGPRGPRCQCSPRRLLRAGSSSVVGSPT